MTTRTGAAGAPGVNGVRSGRIRQRRPGSDPVSRLNNAGNEAPTPTTRPLLSAARAGPAARRPTAAGQPLPAPAARAAMADHQLHPRQDLDHPPGHTLNGTGSAGGTAGAPGNLGESNVGAVATGAGGNASADSQATNAASGAAAYSVAVGGAGGASSSPGGTGEWAARRWRSSPARRTAPWSASRPRPTAPANVVFLPAASARTAT